MSSHQIEDVLSSIRRLVSDDLRPKSRVAPVPELVDKLLLTPALRVVAAPSAPEPLDATDTDASVPVGDRVAESRMAEAVAAWHEDETAEDDAADVLTGFPDEAAAAPWEGAVDDGAVASRSDVAVPNACLDAAVDVATMTAPDATFISHRRVPPEWIDVGGAGSQSTSNSTPPSDQAADTPDEIDGSANAGPAEVPMSAEAGRVAGSDAASAEQTEVRAGELDVDAVPGGKGSTEMLDAIVAPRGHRHATFRSRRDGAAPVNGRPAPITPAEVTVGTGREDAAGPDTSTVSPPAVEPANTTVDMPVAAPMIDGMLDAVNEPAIAQGANVDAAGPVIEALNQPQADAPDGIIVTGTAVEPVPAVDTIEEAVLLRIVREMIHAELQGALGERITRNVRKLVRAEIQRVLATRDLD